MKRKVWLFVGLIIILVGIIVAFFFFKNEDKKAQKIKDDKELLSILEAKNVSFVKTNKKATLYKKTEDKYQKIGEVGKDIELEIIPVDKVDTNIKYFEIKNMPYFISYKDFEVIESLSKQDLSYKNYIPFATHVITTDKTEFYEDDTLVYSINEGIDLPIIIKENDYYYVEYNNQLLGVKTNSVKVEEKGEETNEVASSIATLNYHFFVDDTNKSECIQSICHHVDQFRSHLDYLKENNFYTLRMRDMELFIDGKIRLPKNSVLITIDDGWLAEKGIELLNEYQMNGTLFLMTFFYDPKNYKSDYVEVHSHGHNIHNQGDCPGGQGGAIKCFPEDVLLKDLADSREKLNGSTVFCYPFYEYNDYSISILEKAGFTMAFIGGNRKVTVGTNKMKLPRYPIYSTTTVSDLKQMLN